MSVSYVDRQTLAVLAPTVRAALGMSRTQFGLLVSAFALAYLVGAPLAGALVDRVGARRGLVGAVLVWSAVAAAHALVPGFAALFAMRVALGLAESPSFPAAVQTVSRVQPPERRSAGIGILFTGSSIGASLAAPLATRLLTTSQSWRLAFLGTSVIGLAWVPLWLVATRSASVRAAMATPAEAPSPPARGAAPYLALVARGEILRALLVVLASAPCVMFGLNWTSQYLVDGFHRTQADLGWLVAAPPAFFDVGAIAFGALGSAFDRRAPGPKRTHASLMITAAALVGTMALMPLVHSAPAAVALASAALAGGGGMYALVTADVLARVEPRFTAATGGLCAAAQSIAQIIASPLVGKIADTSKSYDAVLLAFGVVALPVAIVWSLWPVRPRAAIAAPA